MEESPGKAVSRQILYAEFLPHCFDELEIRSAMLLTLLGEEPRELPWIDAIPLRRDRVWSVECDDDVFEKQRRWDLGISLYRGQLNKFLIHQLHHNLRISIMNLDIEGSFLNHIHPSLASVLLFCWRHPRTIVASYATFTRDRGTLWEGIVSLAFFLALLPEETDTLMRNLIARYRAGEYPDEAFNNALRDFFWIRSHLENALLAAQAVGELSVSEVNWYFDQVGRLWQDICALPDPPLTYGRLKEATRHWIAEHGFDLERSPSLSVRMSPLQHLIYRGTRGWSQRCYYTMFEYLDEERRSVPDWLTCIFQTFRSAKFEYADQEGHRFDLTATEETTATINLTKIRLYRNRKIFGYQPRYPNRRFLSSSVRATLTSLQKRRARTRFPDQAIEDNGKLTSFGRAEVERLGRDGNDTRKVIDMLNIREVPKLTVTAIIAYARQRRHQNGSPSSLPISSKKAP